MEQVPGALAQLEELVALGPLRLGAVAAFAKRTAALGGATRAERRAAALLVLGAVASSAGAAAAVLVS